MKMGVRGCLFLSFCVAFPAHIFPLEIAVSPQVQSVDFPSTFTSVHGKIGTWSDELTQKRFSGKSPDLPVSEPITSTTAQIDRLVVDFRVSPDGTCAFFLLAARNTEGSKMVRLRLDDGSITSWDSDPGSAFVGYSTGIAVLAQTGRVSRAFDTSGTEVSLTAAESELIFRSRVTYRPLLPVPTIFKKPRYSFDFPGPIDSSTWWRITEASTGFLTPEVVSVGTVLRVRSEVDSGLILTDGKRWVEHLRPDGSIVNLVFRLPPEFQDDAFYFAPLNSMFSTRSGNLYIPYGGLGGTKEGWICGLLTLDLSNAALRPIRYLRTHLGDIRFVDRTRDGRIVIMTNSNVRGWQGMSEEKFEILFYGE